MADHNDLGKKGEQLAVQFLVKKNWKILHTNWRFGKDEIDIIALQEDTVSFIEVKTRHNSFFGEPHQFVSIAKQKRIIKAAQYYIEKEQIEHEVRFDIIGIILNKNEQKIEHIEDAFSPRW